MRALQLVSNILKCVTFILLFSCSDDSMRITDPNDYDYYLRTDHKKVIHNTKEEIAFWSNRLRPDTTGIGELSPLANSYTSLFEATGDIKYLKNAEVLLEKAYSLPSLKRDEYGRSLAHNYIAQHRFKEALQLLETINSGVSNKRSTGLMLFDVYLEIGEYEKAYRLLDEFENKDDFDYLIRLVKWNDYKGNSEVAIRTMERVKDIAELRGDKELLTWTYNNLAIIYGHSGLVEESYHYLLRSLEIEPDQVVPKMEIAWILYSYEGNSSEAIRILDSVKIHFNSPDLILFQSFLAQFNGDKLDMKRYRNEFIERIENNSNYGLMYQRDLIELFAELDPKRSIRLAELEIENRATPVSYSLLAYAHLQNNNTEKAVQIIKDHVHGRTLEPLALYFSACIYHKAGKSDLLGEVMKQIDDTRFELGPVRLRELSEMYQK